MKQLSSLAALCLLFALGSCKKDDTKTVDPSPVSPTADVRVNFRNVIGGQAISTGEVKYANANGDPYSVDMLKYYVSHLTLISDKGAEVTTGSHKLIDNSDTANMKLVFDDIPNGKYVSARFYLGVDSAHNHSGDQFGDLDPANGMIWTWNTGYIFFKHEGSYKDHAGTVHPLVFHLGTDEALPTVIIPLTNFEVKGTDRVVNITLDLNKLYAGPPLIDFNTDNNRMSTSRADALWKGVMKQNMGSAFTFEAAQ